jgi:membrane-bound lytic murein transglycosylase A
LADISDSRGDRSANEFCTPAEAGEKSHGGLTVRCTVYRLGLTLLTLSLVAGCPKPQPPLAPPQKNYNAELPPGQVALVKIPPEQYPDFSGGWEHRTNLEYAARYSLDYLHRPSSQHFFPYLDISHERAIASNEAFLEVLQSARSPQELDQMIKQRFEVYMSRGCDERGTVLYTGYYRPIFDARMHPDNEFRYPLYKRPADLVQDPVTGIYSRQGGGAYLTRAQIEHGALNGKGLELCYLRDRFETYIVTVQGSARLRMQDGSYFDIGYHGDNGHEYKSIGQNLVSQGLIKPEQLSLQGLIAFFKEHPEQLDPALAVNSRYVFFTPRSGGPFGCLNVPVTPFRTIATDKQVYPRASVGFMQTQLPARMPDHSIQSCQYSGFAMDQDAGGAIRAAGRCDVFLGTGPEVGELAGRTFAEGKLYYIFVKPGQEMSATQMNPPQMPEAPAGGATH